MQEKIQKFSPNKQRILYFVEYLNISKRDFYAKTGISRGTIESSTSITEDTLAKIIAIYKDLSIDWLFTGREPMLIKKLSTSKNDTKQKGIPLIPLSAMAGAFTQDVQVMEYECDRYNIPLFDNADFLIEVNGDSMRPLYLSRDIVACKKLPIDTFFQYNRVYVLDTDQGPLIKRVKKGSTKDTLLIVSENDVYDPFELQRKQIYNIALVLGIIHLD